MFLLSFLTFLWITIIPPSSFVCDGNDLTSIIYNNLNGDYKISEDLEDIEDIDEEAFTVINWRGLNIMLPRTFNNGEISFTDRRWWWSYMDKENGLNVTHPRFMHVKQDGQIESFKCEANYIAKDKR